MIRKFVVPAVLVAAMATTAYASEKVELTEQNKEQIRQVLTKQGYEVGKIKIEDGLYEAYARKDGKKFEVFLDVNMAVVRTEVDD